MSTAVVAGDALVGLGNANAASSSHRLEDRQDPVDDARARDRERGGSSASPVPLIQTTEGELVVARDSATASTSSNAMTSPTAAPGRIRRWWGTSCSCAMPTA